MTGSAQNTVESRAAKGIGMFGGSGVVALFGIGCLLASAIAGCRSCWRPGWRRSSSEGHCWLWRESPS